MTDAIENAAEHRLISPSTLRVRRHREGRREGARPFSVAIPGRFIDVAIAPGLLDAED